MEGYRSVEAQEELFNAEMESLSSRYSGNTLIEETLNGDYYWKNTKDMLLAMAIPDFLGFSDPDVNAGKMSTKVMN